MPDRSRRLNARGHRDAAIIGAYIARHGLAPDGALISNAQRTRETWERVAGELSISPAAAYDERLYNAGAGTILKVLKEGGGSARTLLVIAHNPGLHDLTRNLIASGDVEWREKLNERLPTAGLVVIDFAVEDWSKLHPHAGRLERFVTPRSLAEADRV